MLTPNFQPWLLEINSSPSMARSTKATSQLVEQVLGDMLKGQSSEHWFWVRKSNLFVISCHCDGCSCVGSTSWQDSIDRCLRAPLPAAIRPRTAPVRPLPCHQWKENTQTRSKSSWQVTTVVFESWRHAAKLILQVFHDFNCSPWLCLRHSDDEAHDGDVGNEAMIEWVASRS